MILLYVWYALTTCYALAIDGLYCKRPCHFQTSQIWDPLVFLWLTNFLFLLQYIGGVVLLSRCRLLRQSLLLKCGLHVFTSSSIIQSSHSMLTEPAENSCRGTASLISCIVWSLYAIRVKWNCSVVGPMDMLTPLVVASMSSASGTLNSAALDKLTLLIVTVT